MKKGYIIKDRFVCKEEIGKGGFSTVWLVYDLKLNKNWAAKVSDQRVQSEIETLKALDHSVFPRIVDIVEQEDFIYIIMDYIDGVSLSEYCKLHHVNEKEIMVWMLKVAQALDYLHNRPIPLLYMDCKPENILLTKSGDIRLVDMGSIYPYEASKHSTISSTRFYAPSEVTSPSDYNSIGIHSDVYSFGMTFYRLLTDCKTEYRDKHGRLCPEYKNKHISRACADIVRHCTMLDSRKRYQSMKDIIFDIQNAQSHSRKKIPSILLSESLLKYALSLIIIFSATHSNNLISIILVFIQFVILILLCSHPVCYTWETRKSIIRSY